MSGLFLHSRKRINPDDPVSLEAQRSSIDGQDNTTHALRGKRKNERHSGRSRNKRRRRGKVEESEREEEQITVSAEDEEGGPSSSERASPESCGDVPPEGVLSEEGVLLQYVLPVYLLQKDVMFRATSSEENLLLEEGSSGGVLFNDYLLNDDVLYEFFSPKQDFLFKEGVSSEGQSEELDGEPEGSQSDHRDSDDPDSTLRGELEQRYEEKDPLGEGGFGSVFAGLRREDQLPVAIKHIPADHVTRTTVIVDGEEKEYPLEVVLMSMARPGEGPAVGTPCFSIALLDWFDLQDELVLVMERPVPSVDLVNYMGDRGGSLEPEEAKEVLKQLVEAVIDIQSKGVLHRDIKPDNILVQTDSEGLRLWVLDFGCGTFLKEDPYSSFGGTMEYTPPEWFVWRSYNAEPCTVWQIGVTLYLLLTGRLPFHSPLDIISKELYIPQYLSQYCADLLNRCLDKHPRSRPSLQEILQHSWITQN